MPSKAAIAALMSTWRIYDNELSNVVLPQLYQLSNLPISICVYFGNFTEHILRRLRGLKSWIVDDNYVEMVSIMSRRQAIKIINSVLHHPFWRNAAAMRIVMSAIIKYAKRLKNESHSKKMRRIFAMTLRKAGWYDIAYFAENMWLMKRLIMHRLSSRAWYEERAWAARRRRHLRPARKASANRRVTEMPLSKCVKWPQ